MSERNTPGGFWEKLPDKPEPAQPEAEALAREIGEAVAVTVYNSGDFDVDAAPAIPLIAAFLRRHDGAKEREAAALREIHAQSGQELLDFSQENTALRERLKLADAMAEALERAMKPNWFSASAALAAYRASQGEPKP